MGFPIGGANKSAATSNRIASGECRRLDSDLILIIPTCHSAERVNSRLNTT